MRSILMAAIVGLASTAAQAQVKETITIRPGQQTVLQYSVPFSEVIVGNPKLLDALPRSDRVVVLQAKEPGLTDVLIFGQQGVLQRQITVAVQPAPVTGLVLTHNKKKLPLYTAYICDPICRRTSDPFECADCPDTTSQITSRSDITNRTAPPP